MPPCHVSPVARLATRDSSEGKSASLLSLLWAGNEPLLWDSDAPHSHGSFGKHLGSPHQGRSQNPRGLRHHPGDGVEPTLPSSQSTPKVKSRGKARGPGRLACKAMPWTAALDTPSALDVSGASPGLTLDSRLGHQVRGWFLSESVGAALLTLHGLRKAVYPRWASVFPSVK